MGGLEMSDTSQDVGGNQFVTLSAGSTLTMANLQAVWDAMPHNNIEKIVLIAPNKRTEKQWRKDYPSMKIILAKDHKGYSLPRSLAEVNELVATDSQSQDKPLKSAPKTNGKEG